MLLYKLRTINYYILSLFLVIFFHIFFVLYFISSKNKKVNEYFPAHFSSCYPKKYLKYIKKNEFISDIYPYQKDIFIWTNIPKIIINEFVFYNNGLGIPLFWFDKIPKLNTIYSKIDIIDYDLDFLKNIIKLTKSINCFFQNSKIKIIDIATVKIKISDNEALLIYPWQKFDKKVFNFFLKVKDYINENKLIQNKGFSYYYDLRLIKNRKIIYKQKNLIKK